MASHNSEQRPWRASNRRPAPSLQFGKRGWFYEQWRDGEGYQRVKRIARGEGGRNRLPADLAGVFSHSWANINGPRRGRSFPGIGGGAGERDCSMGCGASPIWRRRAEFRATEVYSSSARLG